VFVSVQNYFFLSGTVLAQTIRRESARGEQNGPRNS
jgi:hypothetical protein